MLDKLIKTQNKFNTSILNDRFKRNALELSEKQRNEYVKEMIFCSTHEMHEMIDFSKWKLHTHLGNAHDDNFLEEWVDAFKFMLNILHVKGFGSNDVVEKFMKKSKVVEFKYQQDKKLRKLGMIKTVVVDIDGVLNSYPGNFLKFVKDRFDDKRSFNELRGSNEYIEYKNVFRCEGGNLESDVLEGVIESMHAFGEANIAIMLLTSRPYKQYLSLFYDTLTWLNHNNIPFEFLYFTQNKAKFIKENIKNPIAFIDDDMVHCNKVAKVCKTFHVNNPGMMYSDYEMSALLDYKVTSINHLKEVFDHINFNAC